jgi:hypothetical protein
MAAGVWQSVAKWRLRLESRERAGEESLRRAVGCHDLEIIIERLGGMALVQDWRRRLMWESACRVEGLAAAAAAPEMLEYVIGGVDLRLTGRDEVGSAQCAVLQPCRASTQPPHYYYYHYGKSISETPDRQTITHCRLVRPHFISNHYCINPS